jgi:F0F1-type ATP synthase assembly protein I
VDLQDRRDTYNGFGNTLARAFELVLTPLLFALLGRFIDSRADTSPLFTIALVAFAVAGVAIKTYYGYVAEMRAHEQRMFGHRDGKPA